MKTLRFAIISLILFSFFTLPLHAQSDNANSAATRQDRIEKAKRDFPIRLSDQETTKLKNRCQAAQANLLSILERLRINSSHVSKKYVLIDKHLTAVQKRLLKQGIDTSVIDLLLTNFKELNITYTESLSGYIQALEDATSLDCQSDAQAFRSILEDVRAKRSDFVDSIQALKNLAQVDLRNSFDSLRDRLEDKEVGDE